MWNYNYACCNYLEHKWVNGRKVKYIARVPVGKNKYRYFYTKEAYQSYLDAKKAKVQPKTTPLNKTPASSLPKTASSNKTPAKISSSTPPAKIKSDNSNKTIFDKAISYVRDIDPKAKDIVNAAAKVAKFLAGGVLGSSSVLSKVAGAVSEKIREKEDFTTLSQLPKQDKKRSADQDQDLVNPDYDQTKSRYSMNCAYCSATWDLRRRGYDVEARPFTKEYDTDIAEIASWYRGTSTEDFVNVSETTYNDMLEQKEGSYGNFVIYWYGGGAHSVVWSVENNEVMIRDTQLNTVDTYEDYMNKYQPYMSSAYYLRTDNRDLNAGILEACRERRIW